MDMNPLKDVADNLKTRNLENKVQNIQEQLSTIQTNMCAVMSELNVLSAKSQQLNDQLDLIMALLINTDGG